ncbi:M56 family metallopeptidase [Pontibacter cellulosilyticus]|uniref:TonB family protein n=1 Tax=Pontibacter cellulosilyticus TaxID=1720253 RepID=A0A923SKM5_9BACT|nr:M56 family metallopeptidase [Pontibacter cellulosilyticus]MBC5995033.1 TonB family protein [Pontibacter cellulosilyticus]
MELTVSYILKSAIVILALYLFYYGLLRNQNSFTFNRLYLLLTPLVALVLPLLKWPIALAPENVVGEALQAIQLSEITVTGYATAKKPATEANNISLSVVASLVYGSGIVLLLFKLAKQLWHISTIKAVELPAETQEEGVKVYQLSESLSTFAFGNSIFLSKQAHLSKTDQEQVLAHELAHVKLRHTWDVVYYEILTAILWANPVVWLLKQELRDVHEYQADARVAESYQTQAYSSLLSKEALLNMGLPVGSYFQKPQVLKRLQMLQLRNNKPDWFRQLLVVPFVAGLAIVFSVQQVDAQSSILKGLTQEINTFTGSEASAAADQYLPEIKPEAETPKAETTPQNNKAPEQLREDKAANLRPLSKAAKEPNEETATSKSEAEKPFVYVEQMPRFKGGEAEMLRYLAKNIRYPKESQEAGKAGLVVVSFVVNQDGSLSNYEVLKSLDEATDAEALRVVKSMNGSWEPGQQNGVPVQVRYTMPVRFTLK